MKNITVEELKNNLIDNNGVMVFNKEEGGDVLYVDFYEPTFAAYFFVASCGTDYTGNAQEATEAETIQKVVELLNADLDYHFGRQKK